MDTAALYPWDDPTLTDQLLSVAVDIPRVPLEEVDPPASPGAYMQFFAAPQLGPILGDAVANGVVCCYAGVATWDLRDRLRRHRRNVSSIEAVEPGEIYISVLPCSTPAAAVFCERSLIGTLDPMLNGIGWGSQVPGAQRTGQRCSAADALLPGRGWARTATPLQVAAARMHVVSNLARRAPSGPRWAALASPARSW